MGRAVIAFVCCLGLAGCVHVNQGSRPLGSIISQSDLPQPGDWCRVTYPETRSGLFAREQRIVTGQVEAVDEQGLHLREVQGRQMAKVPIANRLPYIKRYFKNTGVGCEHDRVVRLSGTEQVEIISEMEAKGTAPAPHVASQQNIAQHLVAAVPGRR